MVDWRKVSDVYRLRDGVSCLGPRGSVRLDRGEVIRLEIYQAKIGKKVWQFRISEPGTG